MAVARDLAQDRDLIFRNLLNGVPLETVARAFVRSREEAQHEFEFVLRKIKSYAFENRMPAVLVDHIEQARRPEHKGVLLFILSKLNLGKDPAFRRISHTSIEEVIRG